MTDGLYLFLTKLRVREKEREEHTESSSLWLPATTKDSTRNSSGSPIWVGRDTVIRTIPAAPQGLN